MRTAQEKRDEKIVLTIVSLPVNSLSINSLTYYMLCEKRRVK